MIKELIKYANKQHPFIDYVPESLTRRNRRALVRSILYLRSFDASKWIVDQPVQRVQS